LRLVVSRHDQLDLNQRAEKSLRSRSDVFFHKTAMAGGSVPTVDMVVEFVEEMGSNGRLRAVNVRPI